MDHASYPTVLPCQVLQYWSIQVAGSLTAHNSSLLLMELVGDLNHSTTTTVCLMRDRELVFQILCLQSTATNSIPVQHQIPTNFEEVDNKKIVYRQSASRPPGRDLVFCPVCHVLDTPRGDHRN